MYRLIVSCENSPGTLSRVVVAVRHAGHEIHKQTINDDSEARKVELDIDATKAEILNLNKDISKMPGVFGVKVYAARRKSTNSVSSPNAQSVESSAARIAYSFPEIEKIVLEIRADIEPDLREKLMFQIGLEVAAIRMDSGKLKLRSANNDLAEIVINSVLPELNLLGEAEYVQEGFETGLKVMSSIFTKHSNSERTSSIGATFGTLNEEAVRCEFLSGIIVGIVNAAGAAKGINHDVTEIRCRNDGHPYCLFDFS